MREINKRGSHHGNIERRHVPHRAGRCMGMTPSLKQIARLGDSQARHRRDRQPPGHEGKTARYNPALSAGQGENEMSGNVRELRQGLKMRTEAISQAG